MTYDDHSETIISDPNASDGPKKPLAPGDLLGSRYIVRKFLGRGGMGEVWLADERNDAGEKVQDVVVKIVPPEVQADAAEMAKIRTTFDLTKRLQHQNICRTLTTDTDRRYGVFLVMDFVAGESLSAYQAAKDGGVFTPEETLEILTPLAEALDFAHGQRILHRDIKPTNIMVPFEAHTTRHREVKLIDFGLAAEMLSSLTSVSKHVVRGASGTLPYMPPEQISGEEQSARSDQYSLAITAYQMLTGRLPFRAPASDVLIYQILNQPVPPILGVPEHINAAISRATAKERKERFSSCGEFVAAMKKPMKQPVIKTSAPPPPPPELPKPVVQAKKKNVDMKLVSRMPAVLWVLLFVFLVGLVGSFFWISPSQPVKPIAGRREPPVYVQRELPKPEVVKTEMPAVTVSHRVIPPPPLEPLTGDGRQAGDRKWLTIKGVDYAFRWCPAGTFVMGSPTSELGRDDDEKQHEVKLTKGFWMLETQVTQEMWQSVMGSNPSNFTDSVKLPVERVSWEDCQDYIQKLNALKVAPAGYRFSLPTEAQWEYACRAGTTTALNSGKNLMSESSACPNLSEVGWYDENSDSKTHEVGKKKANAWGLFDMHGNVWEWCLDWKGDYPGGSVTDPTGPDSGSSRVVRGGNWLSSARFCRSANRSGNYPSNQFYSFGLRLSLVRD